MSVPKKKVSKQFTKQRRVGKTKNKELRKVFDLNTKHQLGFKIL